MTPSEIKTMLQQMVQTQDDFGSGRRLRRWMVGVMSHRTAMAGELVDELCATEEGSPELDELQRSVASVLAMARVAQENRQKRAEVVLKAAADAVSVAAALGQLKPFHRVVLASTWVRSGVPAPAALALSTDGIAGTAMGAGTHDTDHDTDVAGEVLDGIVRDVIGQFGGDPFVLYCMQAEVLPTLPAEMRPGVIAWAVDRPEPIYARLACFLLLDPVQSIRFGTACALADRASVSGLHPDAAIRMVTLRSWMPDDDTRATVDRALKNAMRSGIETGKYGKPWTIHSIMASLPDGGGTQCISIALQLGGSRKIALLLLKQGFGVRGAHCIPCTSATEQKALVQGLAKHNGALRVPLSWLERTLSMALADGLAAGLPPFPGLMQVTELCGCPTLRPEPVTTEALIAALPDAERIGGLPAQVRDGLMNVDNEWRSRLKIVESWFEEFDHVEELAKHVEELAESESSEQELGRDLWNWLETRRGYWARITALAADVLRAAQHPDADSLTATAMALIEGRELKEIPVMAEVHRQTIEVRADDKITFPKDAGPEDAGE